MSKLKKRLLYCNADFDLSFLSDGKVQESASHITDYLSTLFIPISNLDDTVLLDTKPDPNFLDYLSHIGIEYGTLADSHECGAANFDSALFWGHNNHTDELYKRYVRQNSPLPSPELSKLVNSRKYSYLLAEELSTGPAKSYFYSEKLMDEYISKVGFPLVVKPAFGSSAFGFIVLQEPGEYEAQKTRIALLLEQGGASVEEWVERLTDFSYGFYLEEDGAVSQRTYRQLYNTGRGTFLYDYIIDYGSKQNLVLLSVEEKVASVIEQVAQMLYKEAYSGFVNIDAYSYIDKYAKHGINLLSEVNCRFSIADVALYMMRKTNMPHAIFASVPTRKLPFTGYSEARHFFGEDSYNNSSGGVLVYTPLHFYQDTKVKKAARVFIFAGAQSVEVLDQFKEKYQGVLW